jgi:methylmalonyl-CoA/ethylmalonyl-CoA epimerase
MAISGGRWMRIKEVSHIAIAVKDLTSAVRFFEEKFGFETVHRATGGGLHVAFLRGGATPLELLQDELPGGTMEKFIEKRGEGIHHLCFEVKDITVAMQELQTAGVRFLDKGPRQGAHDALVAFIHPKDSYGVLIELAQYEGKPGADMVEKDFSMGEE